MNSHLLKLILLSSAILQLFAIASVAHAQPTVLDKSQAPAGNQTDLVLTVVANDQSAQPGGVLSYTVEATNDGPETARNVKVDFVLSPHASFSSTEGCLQDPNAFPRCNLDDLVAGASAFMTLVVEIDPAATGAMVVEAEAKFSGGGITDSDLSNNTDRARTPIAVEVVVASGANPVIAADPTGSESFAVVWQAPTTSQSMAQLSEKAALGDTGVYTRLFTSQGMPIGIELRLDSGGIASKPDVALRSNGEFVAVWEGADAGGAGIFGQLFSSQGMPIGIELSINATTTLDQTNPSVSSTGDGGFVVSYSDEQSANDFVRTLQFFSSQGMPIGIEMRFGSNDVVAKPPSIIASDSKVLVVWEDNADGVSGQLFSSQGMPIGIEISMASLGASQAPTAAATSNGDFLVVWQDDSGLDGDGSGVFARLLGGAGMPIGIEYRLTNGVSGDQISPKIAKAPDGKFAVTWQGPDGIGARLLSGAGMPIGIELRLGRAGSDLDSAEPAFVDEDGTYFVAWRDESNGDSNVVVGPPDALFADGFESEDFGAWSGHFPR